MTSTQTVIVTRHGALVEYLREIGLAPEGVEVLAHGDVADVADKHVVGVLPLHLAAVAASVTVVPLDLPAELRGVELTLDQVREFAGDVVTYKVTVV